MAEWTNGEFKSPNNRKPPNLYHLPPIRDNRTARENYYPPREKNSFYSVFADDAATQADFECYFRSIIGLAPQVNGRDTDPEISPQRRRFGHRDWMAAKAVGRTALRFGAHVIFWAAVAALVVVTVLNLSS